MTEIELKNMKYLELKKLAFKLGLNGNNKKDEVIIDILNKTNNPQPALNKLICYTEYLQIASKFNIKKANKQSYSYYIINRYSKQELINYLIS